MILCPSCTLAHCSSAATLSKQYLNDGWLQLDGGHDVAPGGVHLAEGAALLGDLLHDLFRAEDGLQIQPFALHSSRHMLICACAA